jgi:predicted nucleic acid-binding Zn ribbon protein
MPTYEFACECGAKQEAFYCRPELAPGELKCPYCMKMMQRQIGPGACVIFKGSGFYCNDSKQDAPVETDKGS